MAIRSLRFWPTPHQIQAEGRGVSTTRRRRRRSVYSRRVMAAFVTLGILGSLVLGFLSFMLSLQITERLNPSGRVYVDVGGEKVYLSQSFEVVAPQAASGNNGAGWDPGTEQAPTVQETPGPQQGDSTPEVGESHSERQVTGPSPSTGVIGAEDDAAPPARQVPLPPVQLQIPAINIDVPIILADNNNLPRQPYAGWLFKSAFPATVGNMVLLGHLDGNAAIFERLNELQPGDEVRVLTRDNVHVYVVRDSETVDDTEVGVVAPTNEPLATLITCAGDWNPYERSYNKRLVVRAYYAAVEDLPGAGN